MSIAIDMVLIHMCVVDSQFSLAFMITRFPSCAIGAIGVIGVIGVIRVWLCYGLRSAEMYILRKYHQTVKVFLIHFASVTVLHVTLNVPN